MAAKKVRSTAKAVRPDSFSDTRIIYIHGISARIPTMRQRFLFSAGAGHFFDRIQE